nr:Chain K, R13 peptide [synthetic construct]3SGE_M Chain M, R13 peptide [synthetic construct]
EEEDDDMGFGLFD